MMYNVLKHRYAVALKPSEMKMKIKKKHKEEEENCVKDNTDNVDDSDAKR